MRRFAIVFAAVVALGIAPVALAAESLSGRWTTTIKGSKLFGGALNGKWVINFTPGAYHVTNNGRAIVHGKSAIAGNVITLKDASGSNACSTKGTYRFALRGTTLTFKRIHDSRSSNCIGRVLVLAHKFTKA